MTGRTAGTNTLNLCAGPGGLGDGCVTARLLPGDNGFRCQRRCLRYRPGSRPRPGPGRCAFTGADQFPRHHRPDHEPSVPDVLIGWSAFGPVGRRLPGRAGCHHLPGRGLLRDLASPAEQGQRPPHRAGRGDRPVGAAVAGREMGDRRAGPVRGVLVGRPGGRTRRRRLGVHERRDHRRARSGRRRPPPANIPARLPLHRRRAHPLP